MISEFRISFPDTPKVSVVLALIGIVTLGAGLYVWQTRGPSPTSRESGYGASLIDPIQPADTQGLLPADGIRAIDDPRAQSAGPPSPRALTS